MHWQFGEMEFGEMKRNTSNWSNFGMLLRRAGLSAIAGLSCCFSIAPLSLQSTRFFHYTVISAAVIKLNLIYLLLPFTFLFLILLCATCDCSPSDSDIERVTNDLYYIMVIEPLQN